MSLTHEPAGSKILEKIKIYILSRAKLLFQVYYEIPCRIEYPAFSLELRSAPTAILKVQPPICLDYRARNRPQLISVIILKDIKYKSKNGEFEMN